MNEQLEITAEIRRWVEKAENDLRNAEYVLTLKEDCPTDTVCFHCQQCAEKYLKALLIFRGVDFPKTHDLVLLFNLSINECELSLQIGEVQPLNRYSVEARYPGDWDPIERQEAAEAVNMARGVRDAVRNVLPKDALQEGK
jgi:HEPN domain-containing protein